MKKLFGFIIALCLMSSVAAIETGLIAEGASAEVLGKELTLVTVVDSKNEAVFTYGDERTKSLEEHEIHRFADGSILSVSEILSNEGEDGSDIVRYFFARNVGQLGDVKYDLDKLNPTVSAPQVPSFETAACIGDGNCADDNPCTDDLCVEGECISVPLEGCAYGDLCVSLGGVVDGLRCIDGGMVPIDPLPPREVAQGAPEAQGDIYEPQMPAPERSKLAAFFDWLFSWF